METNAPFLTRRFDLALHFAFGLHHSQVQGNHCALSSPLLSVCALVLENSGNEDQAIAALLHDAVEDQGGLPTLDTIQRLLGSLWRRLCESARMLFTAYLKGDGLSCLYSRG